MDWGQFAGLAGLMVMLFSWLKLDIRDLRAVVGRVSDRLGRLEVRVARIEGHLGINEPTV
ncbi:MAG: hypothetical protein OXG52_02150 [bacterium]|nr:hypothetical protein [bacterium]